MQKQLARYERLANDDFIKEEKVWVDELERYRTLQVSEERARELRENVVPPLERQVKEEAQQLEKVQEEVEQVCSLPAQPALR